MNGVKVAAAPPNGTLADNRWYLIGVVVRRAGGPLGQLVILSDDPAVPRVEKTFQPDPGTLDTGQNVVIAGNYRGCFDELMISADTWRNYDYFGRLREDALNSVGMGQLNYRFY